MIDSLGTALTTLGLQGKRIGLIGENRYEWEISYLAVVCGVGTIVPFDKSLPENELKRLIERSEIEAIFYSDKYEATLKKLLLEDTGKLKHLISMDSKTHKNGVYSWSELIEFGDVLLKNGNRAFLDAEINPEEMKIMLFTSGTTSESKVVALCHRNLCSNLMDIATMLDVNSDDRFLSFLPLHHVFECTAGFLYVMSIGACVCFCEGVKHIADNLKEFKITESDFTESTFYNNELQKTVFDDCNFKSTEFTQTKLTGINFSSCNIEGIRTDERSLKGIQVNQFQAIELAHLLGIEIVE